MTEPRQLRLGHRVHLRHPAQPTAAEDRVFVMVHQEDTDGLALVGEGGYLPEGEIVLTERLA